MSSPTISRRSLLLGAGATATLSACASKAKTKSPGAPSAEASVATSADTITVMGYAGEHSKEALAAFTKSTGIKVNLLEYTYDKLVAMLAAGKYPDVVRSWGATDTPFLANKKIAAPIDDFIEKSSVIKKDDLGDINNLWRYDGTKQGEGSLYGLVKDYSSDCCLWINKSLVPGVKEGDVLTYDRIKELATAASKIEGGRVKTYGYDFYDVKPNIMHIAAMCATSGKSIWNDDLSQVDLTSAEAVASLQWLRDLAESKATVSSTNKSTINNYDLFKAGRLAILQSGYWTQGLWKDLPAEVQKNFIMIPTPTLGSTRVSPVLSGAGLYIPEGSTKKEAAWKFMEDFFAGQPAKDRAASGWGVPSLKSLMPLMPTTTELNKTTLACQKEEDKYFKVLPFTPYAKIDAIINALTKSFDSAIAKKMSTADMAADATKSINDLLSRGKQR